MHNPWEEIKLDDYENHMKLDSVRQLQTMNTIMRDQFEAYPVTTAMVLGVAGGNGLEHVSRDKYQTVYGVDINEDYLHAVSQRYGELSDVLKCLQINLLKDEDKLPQAELIIANLLIEYIGYETFQKVIRKIRPQYVSCVIQVNTDDKEWVSDSPYIHVFDRLNEVHHQIDECMLKASMEDIGYTMILRSAAELPNGKALVRMDYTMKRKPLILVTNDDGIDSPGLAAAVRAALRVGDVVIAAPNEQQTAMGRAYPGREDLGVIDTIMIDIGLDAPVEAYSVHGSPGYAAAYGIAEIAPKIKGRKPDVTVSGINTGANCGTSITSSGTIGAALESVDMNVPALAMSQEVLNYDDRWPEFQGLDYSSAEQATEYWLRYILEKGMPNDADFLNVNVPDAVVGSEDYRFTFLELHPYYKAQPVPERDWSKPYRIRFDSEFGDRDATEGSDIHTLQFRRKTSVTPLTIDMTKR